MANIMNLKSVRNNTSRNGFDLSFKKNFSAKVGELLPIMCKEVLPGDTFDIDVKALVRTKPVNTAAFARIREYYDFFFVPYNLLWNKADTVLTQMLDNPQHSGSMNPSFNGSLLGQFPYFSANSVVDYLYTLKTTTSVHSCNYFGYDRVACSQKLLEYLGYGTYYELNQVEGVRSYPIKNVNLNVFGLLAYQKIYADFFRDSQWEKVNPSTFNVDWCKGTSDLDLSANFTEVYFQNSYNMFDLRYCNWQKDLYHGTVPQAQYGESSVYPLFPSYATKVVDNIDFTNETFTTRRVPMVTSETTTVSSIDIVKLRQYEFLQKWKEIAQTANKDYKDQIQKHWGVNVGDYASELCQYLGGTSSSIDISEVVNNNITNDAPADIAGKGYGISNGNIHFESKGKYGLLMCIYHAVPMIDYALDSLNPAFTKINSTDIAIPEFDRVGMQKVETSWMNNPIDGADEVLWQSNIPDIGYAPRYIEYKTSVDESVGSFKRSDSHWIVGYSNKRLHDDIFVKYIDNVVQPNPDTVPSSNISYIWNKVNPAIMDSIFAVNADDNLDTDQLLCSAFFDVKAVRNLDTDGLPY